MEASGFASIIVLFFVNPGFLFGGIHNEISFSYTRELPSINALYAIPNGAANSEVDVMEPSHDGVNETQNTSNRSHSNILYELYATIIVLPLALFVLIKVALSAGWPQLNPY